MSSNPLEIDVHSLKSKLDQGTLPLLIDCREKSEYDTVHIHAARLIPLSEFADRVGELEPFRNQEIVIHCHHGGRSLRATKWLLQQGFTNVKSLAGGIDQWAVEIEPTLPRY